MESKDKLVSVVLCTYNGSLYIRPQLDSICAQSYRHIEIVVCDDASTDNTFSILQEYASRDPRIRLSRNRQNFGFTANFEQASHLATGDYIAFADQDDVWHPDKIRRLIEAWKPGCRLMYCDSVRFSGDSIPSHPEPRRNYRRFEGHKIRRLAIINTISGHAMIIDRDFLRLITPFPRELMYDWWAGVIAGLNGGVGLVNEILVYQRQHENNVSIHDLRTTETELLRMARLEMITHVKKFAQIKGISLRDAAFFRRLGGLLERSMQKRFSLPLFIFALLHHRSLFYSKHKSFVFFSRVKLCFKLSTN